jgi:hypothetical protein
VLTCPWDAEDCALQEDGEVAPVGEPGRGSPGDADVLDVDADEAGPGFTPFPGAGKTTNPGSVLRTFGCRNGPLVG